MRKPTKPRSNDEEILHRRIVGQLTLAGVAFFHPPNGSQAAPQYRAKLKRLGVSPGVPDLIIVTPPPCGGYVAAALELKAPGGRLSAQQQAWLATMTAYGWATATAYGEAEALQQLRLWGYAV